MLSRISKIEYVILAVAFLVVLSLRRPPEPGSAQSRPEQDPVSVYVLDETGEIEPVAVATDWMGTSDNQADEPADMNQPQDFSSTAPATPLPEASVIQPAAPAAVVAPRRSTTVGLVDARSCDGLRYDRLMFGSVKAGWIWDGREHVVDKVCVVDEGEGVTSVWSFTPHGKARVSQIRVEDVSDTE